MHFLWIWVHDSLSISVEVLNRGSGTYFHSYSNRCHALLGKSQIRISGRKFKFHRSELCGVSTWSYNLLTVPAPPLPRHGKEPNLFLVLSTFEASTPSYVKLQNLLIYSSYNKVSRHCVDKKFSLRYSTVQNTSSCFIDALHGIVYNHKDYTACT